MSRVLAQPWRAPLCWDCVLPAAGPRLGCGERPRLTEPTLTQTRIRHGVFIHMMECEDLHARAMSLWKEWRGNELSCFHARQAAWSGGVVSVPVSGADRGSNMDVARAYGLLLVTTSSPCRELRRRSSAADEARNVALKPWGTCTRAHTALGMQSTHSIASRAACAALLHPPGAAHPLAERAKLARISTDPRSDCDKWSLWGWVIGYQKFS